MRKFILAIVVSTIGALLASCDLQPKIVALPDTVGEFISARYPTLLADPKTEPEIYNSAVSDYGVYASPDLYGSGAIDDYINYSAVDDYVLPKQVENSRDGAKDIEDVQEAEEIEETEEKIIESVKDDEAEDDVLPVPEYKVEELFVPAHAAVGTVVVKRGDTLYALSREYNLTLDEIAKINNLNPPYTIRVGQILKIEKLAPAPIPETKPESQKKVETKIKPKVEPVVKEAPKAIQKETPKEAVKELPKKVEVRVPVKTITVAKGDTLYSISRRYAVPVNDLAVMNNLSAPFTLRVGDSLRVPDLVERSPVKQETVPVKSSTEPKQEKTKAQSKPATKTKEQVKAQVKDQPKTQTKTQQKVQQKTQTKSEQKKSEKTNQKKTGETKQTKKIEKKVETPKTETSKIAARSSSKFSWPVRGKVLSAFGAKTGGLYNDGINISAAFDSNVLAAENGVVAYAGNEVRGMGNLIIIQHSDGWMTVYAHLNSMSVRRGARVNVGQKIGTVGQTGKVNVPQLHFEIRNGTKAYNPINYLKK